MTTRKKAKPVSRRPQAAQEHVVKPTTQHVPHVRPLVTITPAMITVRREEDHSLIAALARAAADPKTDVDKMERLWAMHKDAVSTRAEQEFNIAKNALQPRLPLIKKNGMIEFIDKKNNKQSTPYALRHDIEKAIMPLYTEAGFSTEYDTEYVDGKIVTVLILRHIGGKVREYRTPPMALDTTGSKNNNQAAGSTMEYGRRQAITSAFNIITEGLDDDGNNGAPQGEKRDQFAARASEQSTKGVTIDNDPGDVGDGLELTPLELAIEASKILEGKLLAADTQERAGAILMQNVRILKELETHGENGRVHMLRAIAEGKPSNAA